MLDRYWFRKILLLVIIVAIVPPIVWGEPRSVEGQAGGDPWRSIIFDFQTLIGGLLAIFAAWWTVDMMEKTDRAAQERHEQMLSETRNTEFANAVRHNQIMKLDLRADMLRVDRLLTPSLLGFVNSQKELQNLLKYDLAKLRLPEQFTDEDRNSFHKATWFLEEKFTTPLSSQAWQEQADL